MSLRITLFTVVALVAGLCIGWGVAQSQPPQGTAPPSTK